MARNRARMHSRLDYMIRKTIREKNISGLSLRRRNAWDVVKNVAEQLAFGPGPPSPDRSGWSQQSESRKRRRGSVESSGREKKRGCFPS